MTVIWTAESGDRVPKTRIEAARFLGVDIVHVTRFTVSPLGLEATAEAEGTGP